MAFSPPHGKTLATGNEDRNAHLWDAATGQLKTILPGHNHRAIALAFALDGKTLATGGRDLTARLWDVATGRRKTTLPGHRSPVMRLAFSPDGRTLATASPDKGTRRWDVATGKPILWTSPTPWTDLPPAMAHPIVRAGAAVVLHDPKDGRVLATLLPIPEAASVASRRSSCASTVVPFRPRWRGPSNNPGGFLV